MSLNIQAFKVPGDNKLQQFAVLIKQLTFSENNLKPTTVDELAVQDIILYHTYVNKMKRYPGVVFKWYALLRAQTTFSLEPVKQRRWHNMTMLTKR